MYHCSKCEVRHRYDSGIGFRHRIFERKSDENSIINEQYGNFLIIARSLDRYLRKKLNKVERDVESMKNTLENIEVILLGGEDVG